MIENIRKRMETRIKKLQEMFNKELEDLKSKQTKMDSPISEMNNTLEGPKKQTTPSKNGQKI